jgi:hypothetical protein
MVIPLLDILTIKKKWPFHLWFTDYQEEMVIPPLVYWLPRRNVHSTFGLFTTKMKWPFPLLFTDSKKKWPFQLWFTDYQEEMLIPPLFYWLPRRNDHSIFYLLNPRRNGHSIFYLLTPKRNGHFTFGLLTTKKKC